MYLSPNVLDFNQARRIDVRSGGFLQIPYKEQISLSNAGGGTDVAIREFNLDEGLRALVVCVADIDATGTLSLANSINFVVDADTPTTARALDDVGLSMNTANVVQWPAEGFRFRIQNTHATEGAKIQLDIFAKHSW